MKYLKIPANPDSSPCRCTSGDPDCDHWESCDGCGMDYRKHEGHDCIDGVPVQDMRALSKELRDTLDACETERDRLRAQIAPLQPVTQGVEVPELTDAFLDLACGPDLSGKADLHSAAFRDLSRLQYRRGWEDLAARLVPTPPQADAVVALTDDMIRREWCNLHSGVEGDPDESAYSAFEEGVRQGFSLRAQPTNNETRG